ncbi:MAG: hypothetical protein MMC33_003482 [Icmadophila ericetorum]|nr:hypothetical protein [Icmadophila ericetorum]
MKPPPLQFPSHSAPRNWLITSAASPIGTALARAVLKHGDSVMLGIESHNVVYELRKGIGKGDCFRSGRDGSFGEREELFARFMNEEVREQEGWADRCRVVGLDGRIVGQCQAAVAEAVEVMGSVDILFCCASEAVIGTVEELAASPRTLSLIREQFETNFFGPVNVIKAVLPAMRVKKQGHIIILTGITSHLGTPGLGAYCASGWALEGFCDSLAYEIAPFNIKTTIVQPNIEIPTLTNRITAAPLQPQYAPQNHPAPLARCMLGTLIDRIGEMNPEADGSESGLEPESEEVSESQRESQEKVGKVVVVEKERAFFPAHPHVQSLYPSLPPTMTSALIAETLHALCAVGGHENPPARHIVGYEGVASVKEKLKTVSEELEDFVGVSGGVDILAEDLLDGEGLGGRGEEQGLGGEE